MIYFILRETFRSLKKVKLYFFFSIFSTTLGLVLIQASFLSTKFVQSVKSSFSQSLKAQVFLIDSLDENIRESIEERFRSNPLILKWKYVSKADAESVFVKETGENFRPILEYNPLPASYQLTLPGNDTDIVKTEQFLAALKDLRQVSDISFEKDLYSSVLLTATKIEKYLYWTAILLIGLSFYIIISMSVFITELRLPEISTMRLVGASEFPVRAPIVTGAAIAGLTGGAFSIGIWSLLNHYFGGLVQWNNFSIFSGNQGIFVYSCTANLVFLLFGAFISFRLTSGKE